MSTLLGERGSIAARIETLRRNLGAAKLDKGATPLHLHRKIAEEESKLAELDAAEAESVRREREAAAAADRQWREREQQRVALLEAQRLEQIDIADKAARECAQALRTALELSASIRKGVIGYGGRPPLDMNEIEKRLSGRLSLVLGTITSARGGFAFGDISLRPTVFGNVADSWRSTEEIEGRKILAELTPTQKEAAQ